MKLAHSDRAYFAIGKKLLERAVRPEGAIKADGSG
jgi:hypothetical protein